MFDNSAARAVERAVEHMKDNFRDSNLSIEEVAHVAQYSRFHFSRVFTRVTGLSPKRFLTALRMRAAMDLLRSTELTVGQIARQVGFKSVGTFSTRFKILVGVAPLHYRQEQEPLDLPGGKDGPAAVWLSSVPDEVAA